MFQDTLFHFLNHASWKRLWEHPSLFAMHDRIDGCKSAIAMEEMGKTVVEVFRFLGVGLEAVDCLQTRNSVDRKTIWVILNDTAYFTRQAPASLGFG